MLQILYFRYLANDEHWGDIVKDLKKLTCALLLVAAFALGMSPVHAGPMAIELSSADGSITVADGGAGDIWNTLGAGVADGIIVFFGSLGAWTLNVETAVDNSTSSIADIHLSSTNQYNGIGAANVLTITLTSTLLHAPNDLNSGGVSDVGGTLGNGTSASFVTKLNGGPAASMGAFGPAGAFSGSVAFPADTYTINPFTLINIATITATRGRASTSSFDLNTTVPEPVALGLLGLGLLGLGFAHRRLAKIYITT